MAPKYANRRARRYRKHYKSKVPSNTTLAKKIKKIQYDQETKYHNENISTTADSLGTLTVLISYLKELINNLGLVMKYV